MRDRKLRRRLAHQHRDGVLVLLARDVGVDLLRLRGEHLRLRGDDVGFRGGAGVVLVLRDVERALILLDRVGEQIVQSNRPRAPAHRRAPAPIAPTAWRCRDRRRSPAPRRRTARSAGAPGPRRRASNEPEISASRLVDDRRPGARERGVEIERRKQARARLGDHRQRLPIIGLVLLQGLIGDGDCRLEPVEFGIVEDAPPLRPWEIVARRGELPALDLFIVRRERSQPASDSPARPPRSRTSADRKRGGAATAQAHAPGPRPRSPR